MIRHVLNFIALNRLQLIQYITIGLAAFSIYFSSFYIFYDIFQLDYKLSASIAYTLTIMSHFSMHRHFTFCENKQKITHNAWKYALMLILNYIILLVAMWLVVNCFNGSPYLGIILSTAITTSANFFMMKYFVFQLKHRLSLKN